MHVRLIRWAALVVLASGGMVFVSCSTVQVALEVAGVVFSIVSSLASGSTTAA